MDLSFCSLVKPCYYHPITQDIFEILRHELSTGTTTLPKLQANKLLFLVLNLDTQLKYETKHCAGSVCF